MNPRLTWGQAKDLVGRPIGLCADHPDLLPLVNEGCKELFNAGDYIHKMARYKFRVTQTCCGNLSITWPSEVETIECLKGCNSSIAIKNVYYEFLENGLGEIGRQGWNWNGLGYGGYSAFRMLGDREEVCTQEDIVPSSKKVKAYSSLPEDNGTKILLLGYDDNNQWIRTIQSGVYADGEYLILNASAPPTTVNFFSKITGVQFTTTPRNGLIYITELNTVNNIERTIGTYQYNEEIPVFRRSVLSGFNFVGTCGSCITGLVRLRFIPIMFDTDYMQISNISAIKDILLALQRRDDGDTQNAEIYRQSAMRSLDNELKQYQGVAPKKTVNFIKRNLWSVASNMR